MDGFKRPKRPTTTYHERLVSQAPPRSATANPRPVAPPAAPPQAPVLPPLDIKENQAAPVKKRSKVGLIVASVFAAVVIGGIGAYIWYNSQLSAVNAADTSTKDVEVVEGATIAGIADKLHSLGLIKNSIAFQLYARLSGASLKASTCKISPSQDARQILTKLQQGCRDFKAITFYPGATIEKPLYVSPSATIDQTMYIKYRLKDAGYSDAQIAAALSRQYSGPLFADKPAGSTLEGYIFGETYHMGTDATAEDALQASFDQMYTVIQQNDIVAKFKKQDLNLFQGITMASIVQRELNCEGKPTQERKDRCYGYQQTIAQVFLKRLHEGVSLGSDVTFIYAADMLGVTPTVDLDSPYNTRIHVGLPPGPIASPGELALKAVANPSNTDYMFFIAGDDGLIYFARTQAEHEANIRDHCQKLCNEL